MLGAKPEFRGDSDRAAELSCAEDMGEDRQKQVDVGHPNNEDTCFPGFAEQSFYQSGYQVLLSSGIEGRRRIDVLRSDPDGMCKSSRQVFSKHSEHHRENSSDPDQFDTPWVSHGSSDPYGLSIEYFRILL